MTESESVALPLGDTPLYLLWIIYWQGLQDLNLRMRESKSRALPLGETPEFNGVSEGIRTPDLQGHNLAL